MAVGCNSPTPRSFRVSAKTLNLITTQRLKMKAVIAVLALATLSGCSTYNTHLKTGCVWTCAEWEQRLAQNPSAASGSGGYSPSTGISSTQVFTPYGGYSVIQSGSTISVIQTSRSR
jgi:hypothetical protein